MSYKFLSGLAKKVAVSAISLTLVLATFSTLSAKAQNTANRGLIISPAISELDADRGSSYEFQILVQNDTDQSMNIKTLLQTFVASSNEGQPTIKDFEAGSTLPSWFSFNQSNFSVDAKKDTKSRFNINVPTDAVPGSYYFAVTYANGNTSTAANGNKVDIETRVQALIFVNVKGKVQKEVKFDTFKTDNQVYDPFFDGIKLDYKISDAGNVYLRPSGNIFVGYDDANPENKASLNPDEKIILPNSTRTFGYASKAQWNVNGISSNTQVDGQYQTLDFKPKWFGNQKVKAIIVYANSDGQLEKKEVNVEVFFFPWKLLSIVVGAILILIAGVVLFRIYKNNKKSSEKMSS
jgi:hypothetical protein